MLDWRRIQRRVRRWILRCMICSHNIWACRLWICSAAPTRACQRQLPSASKSVDETVEEALEYVGRGFKVLKVKLGHSLDEDLARLAQLRERIGQSIGIRVDPNQGYSAAQLNTFIERHQRHEHRVSRATHGCGRHQCHAWLPESVRARLAADETLLDANDALTLIEPPRACGIFNIKLMKCGGVRAAGRIADIADTRRHRVDVGLHG